MSNFHERPDEKSLIAIERLYKALRIKSLNPKTVAKDDNWKKLGLPSTTMIRNWKDEGMPFYSNRKGVWYIDKIAEYFGVEPDDFIDDENISDSEFVNKIKNTPTITENKRQENDESELDKEMTTEKDHEFSTIIPAILENDLQGVKELLDKGIDPNKGTSDKKLAEDIYIVPASWYSQKVKFGYMLPLQLASFYGRTEIVEALIDGGADIECHTIGDPYRRKLAAQSPLYLAAMQGHKEIVNILIKKGAEILPKFEDVGLIDEFDILDWEDSVIHVTTKNNHLDILKTLVLEYGVKEAKRIDLFSLIIRVAFVNFNFEIIYWLSNEFGSEFFNEIYDITYLEIAFDRNDMEGQLPLCYHQISKLVSGYLDDKNKQITNLFLIRFLILLKSVHNLEIFLDSNPDLNLLLKDVDGSYSAFKRDFDYPLIEATMFSTPEIVELLLLKGADPNGVGAITAKELTPLMLCIFFMKDPSDEDYLEKLKLLLNNGADVNKTTKRNTILNYPYFEDEWGDYSEVFIDKNISLKSGTSALMIAAQKGFSNVIKILIRHGADIYQKRKDGETAITLAKNQEIAALISKLKWDYSQYK